MSLIGASQLEILSTVTSRISFLANIQRTCTLAAHLIKNHCDGKRPIGQPMKTWLADVSVVLKIKDEVKCMRSEMNRSISYPLDGSHSGESMSDTDN